MSAQNRILELAFACAESQDQAHFLNESARALKQGCKLGNLDLQMCRIADSLNSDGKWLVKTLAEFVEVK